MTESKRHECREFDGQAQLRKTQVRYNQSYLWIEFSRNPPGGETQPMALLVDNCPYCGRCHRDIDGEGEGSQ